MNNLQVLTNKNASEILITGECCNINSYSQNLIR